MEMALSQPIQKGQQVLSTSSWARKHGARNWISDVQKDSGQVRRPDWSRIEDRRRLDVLVYPAGIEKLGARAR